MFELDKVKKGFPVKVKLVMLRPVCYFVAESLALRALRSLAASNKSTLYDLRVWTRVVWVTRRRLNHSTVATTQLVNKQPLWINMLLIVWTHVL